MAVVDLFLKIDGIEGESQDSKHKGEIQVESFSWGEQQSGTASHGGGMGAGKVQFNDFHFVMKTCKASPKLMLACADGEHIKKAVLTARKAGKDQQEYLKWTFEDLLVSSFQHGHTVAGDVVPTDQVSINFTKVSVDYKQQNADGTLGGSTMASYDIKKMSAGA